MSGKPYTSSEDSALLRSALEGRSGEVFLEIGTGNGGTLILESGKFGVAAGTDLARPAMRDWGRGADFLLADRASCFREGTFDLVAFNPPYLAGEGAHDATVDGGPGLEVPKSFLEDALRAVKKTGSVVFLLNQEAKVEEFEEICRRRGFELRLVASKPLFYEVLSVYEAVYAGGAPRRGEVSGSAAVAHTETSAARRLHQVPASPS